MPDRLLPDSAYDITDPAYEKIWHECVAFHHQLKLKARDQQGTEAALRRNHVDKALVDIQLEYTEKIIQQRMLPYQIMRSADYNPDAHPGYGVIWRNTRQFHDNLRDTAEKIARHESKIVPDETHAENALKQVTRETFQRLQLDNRTERQELWLAVASGLIGVFLSTIPAWFMGSSPSPIYWVLLLIGIVMILRREHP